MRNIFLKKSYRKSGREASLKLFPNKIKIEQISLDQQSQMLWSLFLLYVQVEVYQNILKLGLWHFQKTKRGLELVPLSNFLHVSWIKYFSDFILLTDQIL